jgi:hypothetical protein
MLLCRGTVAELRCTAFLNILKSSHSHPCGHSPCVLPSLLWLQSRRSAVAAQVSVFTAVGRRQAGWVGLGSDGGHTHHTWHDGGHTYTAYLA